MARIVVTGLPDPPDGRAWCTLCAALAKGEVVRLAKERIEAALADDKIEVVAIAANPKLVKQLETGVMWGAHPRTGNAAVLLCWTHAPAMDGSAPDGPPPPGQQSPLLRGLS